MARPRRAVRDVLIALIFGLAALALAVIGIAVNARYWSAFGQSPDAVVWLAAMVRRVGRQRFDGSRRWGEQRRSADAGGVIKRAAPQVKAPTPPSP
jgi:hypothetical protein